ncbi:MAG TPA: hypothetical protein VN739_05680 [Nitrososphaerales archaeon]|nr:hypothetical protein [Nitrososphaerales archaeon]
MQILGTISESVIAPAMLSHPSAAKVPEIVAPGIAMAFKKYMNAITWLPKFSVANPMVICNRISRTTLVVGN